MSVNENAVEVPSPKFIECKFTVESRWERNGGGVSKEKCVTFDGFATTELYDAIIDAIREVVE